MNMLKQTALATVLVTILSGCGLSQNHVRTEQTATDPSSTVASSSPQTDLVCPMWPPTPCPSAITSHFRGSTHDGRPTKGNGYELNGWAWLCSDTGEYCVEEGGSIRFSGGHLVEGPDEGTYEGK